MEKRLPLSGVHVSIVPRVFFFLFCAEGLLVRFVLKVKAPFLPKVVWFGPFERSKPLGVLFAHFVPLVPKVF